MVPFTSVFALVLAAAGILAAPTSLDKRQPTELAERQTITASQTGTNNGYYYQLWTEGTGTVDYTNGAAGEYAVTWTDAGDFTAGKGWATGSARAITFSATNVNLGTGYLSVYGWSTDPLVEYYIVEDWAGYDPSSGGTYQGTLTSDGATYDVYEDTRTNEPSIEGTATFNQYWSVRQTTRTSGTVTTANHFDAWASLGMNLGTFNYQIVSTEGFGSSGSATVTVS
ncbi:glycoside hydrolase family 11 protein [Calocera viscosa TUFC12733]|uniref:Endo-1,4-beta-xylanase n=1 Tax=Calocera viscosa (strain TUFC12733) TaxID=1330018 RepID=A0A167IM53_CALVF|nr:glycoside hydrolase family 11 protein [Calocera viscosa TUFC12733]